MLHLTGTLLHLTSRQEPERSPLSRRSSIVVATSLDRLLSSRRDSVRMAGFHPTRLNAVRGGNDAFGHVPPLLPAPPSVRHGSRAALRTGYQAYDLYEPSDAAAPLAAHHRRLPDQARLRARSSARASPSRSACSAQVRAPNRAAWAARLGRPTPRPAAGQHRPTMITAPPRPGNQRLRCLIVRAHAHPLPSLQEKTPEV